MLASILRTYVVEVDLGRFIIEAYELPTKATYIPEVDWAQSQLILVSVASVHYKWISCPFLIA